MESPRAMILTVDCRSASSAGAAATAVVNDNAAHTVREKLNSMSVIPMQGKGSDAIKGKTSWSAFYTLVLALRSMLCYTEDKLIWKPIDTSREDARKFRLTSSRYPAITSTRII